MLRARTHRGFTLIELMIVIAIIGILAGVMVPNFMKARAEANLSGCQSNLKNIGTAMEMFNVRHKGDYPANLDALKDEEYLKSIPTCPSTGTMTYQLQLNTTDAGVNNAYTLYCAGTNHSAAGLGADSPKYTSVSGLIE